MKLSRFQVIDTTYTFVSKNDTKLVGMVQHLQNEHRMYRNIICTQAQKLLPTTADRIRCATHNSHNVKQL
eukprot:m.47661 g.47661  ORF g.47661 m.47661 type:complete len:70 (+) comp10523_c0_seq1:484-693(+)